MRWRKLFSKTLSGLIRAGLRTSQLTLQGLHSWQRARNSFSLSDVCEAVKVGADL